MTSIIAMTFLIGFTVNEAYAGTCEDDCVPCEDDCFPCEEFCRATLLVDIDVKPGSDPNSVNVNTKGVLPVAIIGSDDFDATQIDPSSISAYTKSLDAAAGGVSTSPLRCSIDDVNEDGILDVNCKFSKEGLMLDCWTNGIIISGNLFDGTPFTGSDTIRPVPCAEDF